MNKIRTFVYEIGNTKWFLPSLFLFSIILLFLRKPIHTLIQPGRVEDVDIFLQQAIQHSWGSLFDIYNYYLTFIARLITIVSLYLLGITNAPLGMNISAIVITVLCAVFFATKQFRFIIKNDLLRALCSLFIIAVPNVGDIYSNLSIEYFLTVFVMLFVTLLVFNYDEYEKKSRKKKCFYTFICSMSFLTSPFTIIFLPVLIYVIIREFRRNKKKIFTISSYAISTILLLIQTLILYFTYSQQFKSPILDVTNDVITSSINGFTIVATRIFYHDTSIVFQHFGEWMYLVPITIVAFVLLNSIKTGSKFEIFTIIMTIATLFCTSMIRRSLLDWACLCGGLGDTARYFLFTAVFLFILIIRQLDKIKPLFFKFIFLFIIAIIIFNVASSFFIQSSTDKNWEYVAKLYDPSGAYKCYVGEVPQGWALTIPCSTPVSSNMTITQGALSTGSGPSITFTPPIQTTTTSIVSNSSSVKFGQGITFTATVSPTPDYGAVQFYIDDMAVGKSVTIFGGQSIFSTSSLSVGSHHIFASYSGAPDFVASTSDTLTVIVLPLLNP